MSDCCSTDACATDVPAAPECPSCGAKGAAVDAITMKALLGPEGLRRGIPPSPRFCATAECPVVYFDNAAGVIFEEALLTVPVHAKHPENDNVPVCYCFAQTARSIRESQAREGRASVSKAITAEVRAGHCACEVKNPKGVCCLGDVVRVEREIENVAANA